MATKKARQEPGRARPYDPAKDHATLVEFFRLAHPGAEFPPETVEEISPVRLVFENAEGQVTRVLFAYRTLDLYPLIGKEQGGPAERLAALKALIAAAEQEVWGRVLVQLNLFPGLNAGLGPAATQLRRDGWIRCVWLHRNARPPAPPTTLVI